MFEHFLYNNGWFDKKYKDFLTYRYPTTKLALNLFAQCRGAVVVETGCVREENDSGAGSFTTVAGDVMTRLPWNPTLYSVDNNDRHIEVARRLTAKYGDRVKVEKGDSVEYLSTFPYRIDLLYLDSMDYPLKVTDGPVEPPQEHCLAELKAAIHKMNPRGCIMIDDNHLPGGGKSLLAKQFLMDNNYTCLLDIGQTVWVKW